MRRYFVTISYHGGPFCGWQKQADPKLLTVQGEIERCLSFLVRQPIEVVGCGRTDTGVHAKNYVFHVDLPVSIVIRDLQFRLNAVLPKEIVIHQFVAVKPQAHARFDALQRSYTYHLRKVKWPFDLDFCMIYNEPQAIDLDKLNAFAKLVAKYGEFYPFCKTHTDVLTYKCTIYACYWTYSAVFDRYEFHITADRFLRGMIRLLVGAALMVNKGKLSQEAVEHALIHQSRLPVDWSVPAHGLTLHDITYDDSVKLEEES